MAETSNRFQYLDEIPSEEHLSPPVETTNEPIRSYWEVPDQPARELLPRRTPVPPPTKEKKKKQKKPIVPKRQEEEEKVVLNWSPSIPHYRSLHQHSLRASNQREFVHHRPSPSHSSPLLADHSTRGRGELAGRLPPPPFQRGNSKASTHQI